jgi:hypothetical protein
MQMDDESESTTQDTNEASATNVQARLVVIQISDDGNFTVNPIGVDQFSVPTILRKVAREVEGQLGA